MPWGWRKMDLRTLHGGWDTNTSRHPRYDHWANAFDGATCVTEVYGMELWNMSKIIYRSNFYTMHNPDWEPKNSQWFFLWYLVVFPTFLLVQICPNGSLPLLPGEDLWAGCLGVRRLIWPSLGWWVQRQLLVGLACFLLLNRVWSSTRWSSYHALWSLLW